MGNLHTFRGTTSQLRMCPPHKPNSFIILNSIYIYMYMVYMINMIFYDIYIYVCVMYMIYIYMIYICVMYMIHIYDIYI